MSGSPWAASWPCSWPSPGAFFPLASLLEDRLLVALGVSVTTVAVVALVAGLATGVAPSTVTGVGAGVLLTGFGVAALAGVDVERTPQPSSPDGSAR